MTDYGLNECYSELERLRNRVKRLGNKWVDYSKNGAPVMYWSAAGEYVLELLDDVRCSATVTIHGDTYYCDWSVLDEYGNHTGWAHRNKTLDIKWGDGR